MRLMMHCMSSTGSLSAFSASVVQSGIGPGRPVQGVRALDGTTPTGQASAGPVRAGPPRTGETAPPTRNLPRGSLLDLTV
jgi:hypothetical protein